MLFYTYLLVLALRLKGNIHTKSSCLASMTPKSVPPKQPENLPSEFTNSFYSTDDYQCSFENNTMYSFDAYKQLIMDYNNTIMPTVQNDQCDTTTATTSTASSEECVNTNQPDHQFRQPDVPCLRHYRHPTKGLKCDHGNASITSTHISGCLVGGTSNAVGVVVGDEDLGGGYVYADEDIWDCCEF